MNIFCTSIVVVLIPLLQIYMFEGTLMLRRTHFFLFFFSLQPISSALSALTSLVSIVIVQNSPFRFDLLKTPPSNVTVHTDSLFLLILTLPLNDPDRPYYSIRFSSLNYIWYISPNLISLSFVVSYFPPLRGIKCGDTAPNKQTECTKKQTTTTTINLF